MRVHGPKVKLTLYAFPGPRSSSSVFTFSDTLYEETPPIHLGTRTVMRHDSTGQFEGGECLEGASSLSAARFEGTGLLQHGSYAIGCKRKTRENSLILEVNTKRRILYPGY